jgi:hypothetical protein
MKTLRELLSEIVDRIEQLEAMFGGEAGAEDEDEELDES